MIGLMNYYMADNYGAVLQCYALQQAIKLLGKECEIIKYECGYIHNYYKLLHLKPLKRFASDIIYYKNNFLKKKEFIKFRKKYLKSGDTSYNKENIESSNMKYDIFITGSDQVFNYKCTDFDRNYFLDFVNEKNFKCAYAASYGIKNVPEKFQNDYRRMLSKFDYLTFRENDGVKITEELIGSKGFHVLDPTLLVSKEVWNFEGDFENDGDYILVYLLERSKELIEFVKRLSQKTGFKIVYIGSLVRQHRQGMKAVYAGHESPERFVNWFKKAKYVVTNSFHGMAFSIIFQREFFVEKLNYGAETNGRFISLLNQLHLSNRMIDANKTQDIDTASIIDYKEVDTRLNILKDESMKHLKNICCIKE